MTVTILDRNDIILTNQNLKEKLIEPEAYYQFMNKVESRIHSSSSVSRGESYAD